MLILASSSPRRQQLLASSHLAFDVIPANVDESRLVEELPQDYVTRLAKEKAQTIARCAPPHGVVVAADTTVAINGTILGKPVDQAEAMTMLRLLRGRIHQVYTGLAVFRPADETCLSDWCVTHVQMRDYDEQEMLAYVATGDPLDKAGAYAIQHEDFKPVAQIQGCYANIVGLPLCHLTHLLERLGIQPPQNMPEICRDALQVQCVFNSRSLSQSR
jgi:MAF protein